MKSLLSTMLLAAPAIAGTSYQDAIDTLKSAPEEITEVTAKTPTTYRFNSQLSSGNSVSFTGQTFRQVLISDLVSLMKSYKVGEYNETSEDMMESLVSYFEFDMNADVFAEDAINGLSYFNLQPRDIEGKAAEILEGLYYEDLNSSSKQIANKLAGNDNKLRHGRLLGWDSNVVANQNLKDIDYDGQKDNFVEPEDLIVSFFTAYSERVADGQTFTVPNGSLEPQRIDQAMITESGLDLAQLTEKFIHGALSFSQATGDYLSTDLGSTKGLNASNDVAYKDGKNYTKLEHHWDEGFGYVGAAKDVLEYSKLELAKKLSRDTNSDGKISIKDEVNFSVPKNSAKRDLEAKGETKLLEGIHKPFFEGRQLMTERPNNYLEYVKANAVVAAGNWEKLFAANTIHYINKTINEYNEYSTSKYLFKDFAKYWGEMKGFALGMQFNPNSIITKDDFKKVHKLMKDAPIMPHAEAKVVAAYIKDLESARNLLRDSYGFSEKLSNNW